MPSSLRRAVKFESEPTAKRGFLENKAYLMISLILSLFYFLDVFVGMFIIQTKYGLGDRSLDTDKKYQDVMR